MKKLFYYIIGIIVLATAALVVIPNQHKDHLNPYIKMETDYAKVPKNTQKYYNVQSVDRNGKKLPYKIKYVGGYDPSQEYIAIHHKRQYVKLIEYIPKNKMPKNN